MKIIIATGIYPPEIGGPATLTWALQKTWRHLGYDVHVVAYGESSEEKGVTRVSRKYPMLLRYILFTYKVWRACRSGQVLFIQGAVSEGLPATIAGKLRHIPMVMRIPGDYAWEIFRQDASVTELLDDFVQHTHAGKIGFLERIERWTAAQVQSLVTPSRYLKSIVKAWAIPAEKIHVILNTFTPFNGGAIPLRGEYELEGKKIFLTVVRAVPWKHTDFLLQVFQGLPKEYILVIAGDGPCLAEWQKLAQDLAIKERIIFLGRIDREQLARWYQTADAFLLPSAYEGYPFVVAEAVSFGLPCLVSDMAGNPETKEQYPQHVTVLPFKDISAWQHELVKERPRLSKIQNKSFDAYAKELLAILKLYENTPAK